MIRFNFNLDRDLKILKQLEFGFTVIFFLDPFRDSRQNVIFKKKWCAGWDYLFNYHRPLKWPNKDLVVVKVIYSRSGVTNILSLGAHIETNHPKNTYN